MRIVENEPLLPHNTLGVDLSARYFAQVKDLPELQEALTFARCNNLPFWVIGGGSNTVITQDLDGLVICMAIKGIEVQQIKSETVGVEHRCKRVIAGAGESWDQLVAWSLEHQLYGLENLSLIPGSVGAAPVQNIGAYGVELSEFLEWVEVWDVEQGITRKLPRGECQLSYRDSVFKHELKGQVVITRVALRLSSIPKPNLSYDELKRAVECKVKVDPLTIREKVITLRQQKLPSPEERPNVGSFFKNPVITQAKYQSLCRYHPDIPAYPSEDDRRKIPAAWLIDRAGWKGENQGGISVFERHALVLINDQHADGQQILRFARQIQDSVKKKFAVVLELEPQVIP